jgi:hypothetical protein
LLVAGCEERMRLAKISLAAFALCASAVPATDNGQLTTDN